MSRSASAKSAGRIFAASIGGSGGGAAPSTAAIHRGGIRNGTAALPKKFLLFILSIPISTLPAIFASYIVSTGDRQGLVGSLLTIWWGCTEGYRVFISHQKFLLTIVRIACVRGERGA